MYGYAIGNCDIAVGTVGYEILRYALEGAYVYNCICYGVRLGEIIPFGGVVE